MTKIKNEMLKVEIDDLMTRYQEKGVRFLIVTCSIDDKGETYDVVINSTNSDNAIGMVAAALLATENRARDNEDDDLAGYLRDVRDDLMDDMGLSEAVQARRAGTQ